ncbi:unnamed protein product [Miscanthus lutarioriparius]|uniref:Uncharacterized protein n=1 Tax=Miscanthus lutarioriparius TaxID=422564 RepID=A0A811SFB4_9POAL|nr:unnamed protein product [Miscanthus lutarioriparius]
MDLLEHPLEAVAFRLYSLPIPEAASAATGAAAAWTCLAAVLAAAAAGLWRLRSSTPAAAVAVSTKPLQLDPSRSAEVSSPEPPSRPSLPTAAASTKERYTAYYRDAGCVGCCDVGSDEDGNNDEEEDDDADEEHEDGDRNVFVSDGADPFGWEVVRSLRPLSPTAAAEMGRRYRRSPTAALSSGSVVQLWDHGAGAGAGGSLTTPMASPRRRGRVVVGAVSAF